MRLTFIHPSIGRRAGQAKYIPTWQMEPLGVATLAGNTPSDIDVNFYDDRVESIPFDVPTDLVAISVETYTAKRAYQIASEYRKRNIPVVMGGFHATLCPEEVSQYAEAVVIGESELVWHEVLRDAERGTLKTWYKADQRCSLVGIKADRSIYSGKNYLPVTLLETSRGCEFRCEFCAIQEVFNHSYKQRSIADIVNEIQTQGPKKLYFFVDDNISSDIKQAKELLRALIPLKIRWVSQMSVNAAHDEELLSLLKASGCLGVLIGFESLNSENLKHMNKSFNEMDGGYEKALVNLRKYDLRLYITFVFGYDHDTVDSFRESVDFAIKNRFYIAAYNHLTPFPGTALYRRLEKENRLLYEKWWLDDDYSYNKLPFQPASLSPEEVQAGCIDARQRFYSTGSIVKRGFDKVNRGDLKMWLSYYGINWAIRKEIHSRKHYPLGDENWTGEIIKAREWPAPLETSA